MAEYIITTSHQIVAQDLADAIRANEPDAHIIVVRDVRDTLAALEIRLPDAVILHRPLREFTMTPLAQKLSGSGVPWGFLGGEEASDAVVLASPFSEATVATLLEELRKTRERGSSQT